MNAPVTSVKKPQLTITIFKNYKHIKRTAESAFEGTNVNQAMEDPLSLRCQSLYTWVFLLPSPASCIGSFVLSCFLNKIRYLS